MEVLLYGVFVMKKTKTVLVLTVSLLMVGCASKDNPLGGPKQTAGTLVGAAGGALIGSQFGAGRAGIATATALGTLGGAVAGGAIGRHLDNQDKPASQ